MNIYQKLNQAREQFHQIKMEKSGKNTFAKYDYFTLSDFIKPALKVMSANGLCATVSFDALIATMTIVNIEKPDETIVLTSPMGSALLKGCHEVQNIGAVETYQRRYLWVAALEIIEQDALEESTGQESKAPKIDDKRLLKAIESIKSGTYTTDKLRAAFALTEEQDAKVVAELSQENA
jgi:hypothetical protein